MHTNTEPIQVPWAYNWCKLMLQSTHHSDCLENLTTDIHSSQPKTFWDLIRFTDTLLHCCLHQAQDDVRLPGIESHAERNIKRTAGIKRKTLTQDNLLNIRWIWQLTSRTQYNTTTRTPWLAVHQIHQNKIKNPNRCLNALLPKPNTELLRSA